MEEGRAIIVRVIAMNLLIIPCWFLHRELIPPPGTGWYLNLFFFFFGPIFAGFYAGASSRSAVLALYTVVIASVSLTLIYTVLWLTDMFYFELIPLMVQLFSLIFALLLAGTIPVFFSRKFGVGR
jgi:hypothetical protein